MKKHKSNTKNGGITIILDSLDEAINIGRGYVARRVAEERALAPESKHPVLRINRDKPSETEEITAADQMRSLERRARAFKRAVNAIRVGDQALNRSILDKAERLADLVTAIEPSLAANYAGFERSEDGIAIDVGLLASGDDRPFFKRASQGEIGNQGGRGRAYRVVLNTDVSWFGSADDNAAVVGALVLCLQRFGPVELWIQQGWLGDYDDDGVTLFKLDFSQGFEPAQLAFWCGHELKDNAFSFEVNMGLGRRSSGSSKSAEIPADLFLRGDWMKVYGINEGFDKLLHTEQVDLMAKWIAQTAMQILKSDAGTDDWFSG